MRITATALTLALLSSATMAFAQGTEGAVEPAPQAAPTETEATTVPAAPAATAAPAAITAPAIAAPEGYSAVEFTSVTAEELKGVDIYDVTDASVAEVADLVIDGAGKVTGIVTDVGGFLGMGEHRISLSPEQVSFYRNADGDLRGYVSLSKDQLKALPAWEAPAP